MGNRSWFICYALATLPDPPSFCKYFSDVLMFLFGSDMLLLPNYMLLFGNDMFVGKFGFCVEFAIWKLHGLRRPYYICRSRFASSIR